MATQHIAEEDLEAYALGHLVAAAALEKHLLGCAHCMERLAELEWKIIRQARRAKKKTK